MGRMQFGQGGGAAGMGYGVGGGMGGGVAPGMGYGGGMFNGGGLSLRMAGQAQQVCDGFGVTYGLDGATARLAAGLGDVFSFSVAAGEVTGAAVTLPWGTTIQLPVSAGVDYGLAGTDVLATRALAGGFSQVRYSDVDADGFYQAVSTARVLTTAPHVNLFGLSGREALEVTATGGVVTGVTQILPNGYEWVRLSETTIPDGVAWARQGELVVETATFANGATSWEVFRDGNGDGRYTEVASGTGQLVDLVGVLDATQAVAPTL